MGIRVKQAGCLYCGKEVLRKPNIYCDNTCQHKYKTSQRFLKDPSKLGPAAIRTYMLFMHEKKCMKCQNTDWLDKPITLEVDHIDGNSSNNQAENLRLLCPNCHSQTPSYKGKNKGNGRHSRLKRYHDGKSY